MRVIVKNYKVKIYCNKKASSYHSSSSSLSLKNYNLYFEILELRAANFEFMFYG